MIQIPLKVIKEDQVVPAKSKQPVTAIVLPILFMIIIFIVILLFFIFKRRKRKPVDEDRRSNLEVAQQNSVIYRQHRQKRLSQSRFSVNVMEVKNSTVNLSESGGSIKVKIKNTNIKSQGKPTDAGTEV